MLEIGALFALLLAGICPGQLADQRLGGGGTAVGVVPLCAGAAPHRKGMAGRSDLVMLVVAIAALIVGSIFVFRSAQRRPGGQPRPGGGRLGRSRAAAVVYCAQEPGGSRSARRRTTWTGLIGMTGTAHTDLRPEGSVYVDGRGMVGHQSRVTFPSGTKVRVSPGKGWFSKSRKSSRRISRMDYSNASVTLAMPGGGDCRGGDHFPGERHQGGA